MEQVQAPVIPIVGELLRDNPAAISLGQGVVSYGPPQEAIDAISHFLRQPENHKYKLVDGIPELKQALSEKLTNENKISLNNESDIIVSAGSNMAFLMVLMAIADPGDEIILLQPYYFNHEMAAQMCNVHTVAVPTGPDYQLDLDRIHDSITAKTRAVVTVSPNNPSGAVYPPEALASINRLCSEKGIYHISDEAYEYFCYDGVEHFSPGADSQSAAHTISLFSLSKAYGFASWRIGYAVVPKHLVAAIKKAQDTNLICPPVISQYAAVGALRAGRPFVEPKLAALADVRRRVLSILSEDRNGFYTFSESKGAFYFLI